MSAAVMSPEVFEAQVPIAIEALGAHIRVHKLCLPMSIDVHPDEQQIKVRLSTWHLADQQAWLDSLVVDEEHNTKVQRGGGSYGYRTRWLVRLPDLGVRFELTAHRQIPLQVVAGAAS